MEGQSGPMRCNAVSSLNGGLYVYRSMDRRYLVARRLNKFNSGFTPA